MDYNKQSNYGQQSTGNYAAVDAAPQVETPSRIRDGISNAEQLVSIIHESISALDKRLDTVLRPNAPTPTTGTQGGNALGPNVSHVTGRINLLIEALTHANQRLSELAGRVEV